MFTGLVETVAEVRSLDRRGPAVRIRLGVELADVELGESISTSGVCLTVTAVHHGGFEADVSVETLSVTTLGELRVGSRVNIERSSRLGDRMGGHLVLGHVDAVGTVKQFEAVGDARLLRVEAPEQLQRYLAPKGSIAVDGVSLTINQLRPPQDFEIMLVPHTLQATTLRSLQSGRRLNLEVDVLARYVARQLDCAGVTKPTQADGQRDEALMDLLQQGGFVGGGGY
jgi:riboflavin synthase